MRNKIIGVLAILLLIGIALQFIRPRLDNPPVTEDIRPGADLAQILHRSCYNCHSNETKLAWFDEVVPAYWTVAADVRKARQALNFSHWDSLSADQQKGKLFEGLNLAAFKVMPLAAYRLLHPGAALSDRDLAVFRTYLLSLPSPNLADSARISLASNQYNDWMAGNSGPAMPDSALNGLTFPKGFEHWEVVSTSDRFDNGTMRVILGNAVAIKALDSGRTTPWPDGAIFAKIAWDKVEGPDGVIHTGAFKQVEFMTKDARRYASTDGWGFARWVNGLSLVPYGKDALFATECTHCHAPMKDHDFFYSLPPARVAPSGYQVIASLIDPRDSSTATLYGNPIAVTASRGGGVEANSPGKYPQGSSLLLATWHQKSDPHWFGASIQGAPLSVERVEFGPSGAVYSSNSAQEQPAPRLDYITHLKASVLP
jgi:hypothetical protein